MATLFRRMIIFNWIEECTCGGIETFYRNGNREFNGIGHVNPKIDRTVFVPGT